MNSKAEASSPVNRDPACVWVRLAIVLAGIIAGQCYLYGPALFGRQLLLPVDLLLLPDFYLQQTGSAEPPKVSDWVQSDQILQYEPARRFASAEIHAGRWPAWSPYQFCGSPALGIQWSCFQILYILWPTPRILPVIQIFVSLVAGTGAYVFFRRVFELAYWPATIAAWCYPLTGFFVLWQGHSLPHSAVWLPWILWSTDRAIRNPRGFDGVMLAVFTFFTIGCGAVDIAGQLLLVSGSYALLRVAEANVLRWTGPRSLIAALMTPVAGWTLGFIMAAGMLLPMADYLRTGTRMQSRHQGHEERPPVGLEAVPLVCFPDWLGTTHRGSYFIGSKSSCCESAATAYAGLFGALFLVPLARARGMHGKKICLWCLFGFLGMAWQLNVPGLVQIYRLPVLNMFSFNRFTFVTGWAILCLAALGLDSLFQGVPKRRWWYLFPMLILLVMTVVCLQRAWNPPEPIATQLEKVLRSGQKLPNLSNLDDLAVVRRGFVMACQANALLCGSALVAWVCALSKRFSPGFLFTAGSCSLLFELLWFASRSVVMCDPQYYYPQIPVVEQLAQAPPGRFLGVGCLPPRVVEHYGLRDVRGYDAVDPSGIVDLLDLVRDKRFSSSPYARTQTYIPLFVQNEKGSLRLPGVLSLLNVRYLVFCKATRIESLKPLFSGDGYSIWENPDVLARAFVPRNVTNDRAGNLLLATMADSEFNAAEHSYAEIARSYRNCRGQTRIVREHSQEVELDIEMETPGLVILSDLWYSGWQATLDGLPVPIVRANYSLRGVEVPAGHSVLVMKYKPPALKWGLRLSIAGLFICVAWACHVAWSNLRSRVVE